MKMKALLKSFLFAFSVSIAMSVQAIDVLIVFTPSGFEETNLDLQAPEAEVGKRLIDELNDIYENGNVGRIANLVGEYQTPLPVFTTTDYNSDGIINSKDIHSELSVGSAPWALDVREKRDIYGADIVFFIWGFEELGPDPYGGLALRGSGYITVNGDFSANNGSKIMEHELGHELGLPDPPSSGTDILAAPGTIMSDGFDINDAQREHIFGSKGGTNYLETVDNYRARNSDRFLFHHALLNAPSSSDVEFLPCSAEGTAKAKTTSGGNAAARVAFRNYDGDVTRVYWLNNEGNRSLKSTLNINEVVGLTATTTSPFLVEVNGECVGIVKNIQSGWEYVEITNRDQYLTSQNYKVHTDTLEGLELLSCRDAGLVDTTWESHTESTKVVFENESTGSLKVYWVRYDGSLSLKGTLSQGQSLVMNSYTTHSFYLENSGQCVGYIENSEPGARPEITVTNR